MTAPIRLPSRRSAPSPEWTPDQAEERARGLGIVLSPFHWQVLAFAREECLRTHRIPDACRIAEAARLPRADLERLFPGRTCAVIAHLAGLPARLCRKSPE